MKRKYQIKKNSKGHHIKFFITAVFFVMMFCNSYGQKVLDYKYVLVPEEFIISKTPNEYGLNTATKQQLRSYGLEAYLKNETLPFNLKDNLCEVLNLSVEEESSLLKIKIKLILSDCEGKLIFVSQLGESKEKFYQKAYTEAFREALVSFKSLRLKKTDQANNYDKPSLEVLENNPTQTIVDGIGIEQTTNSIDTISSPISREQLVVNTLSYKTFDGVYQAIRREDSLTFFEGSQKIGAASIFKESIFIETTEFSGNVYFKEENFIIKRYIRGVGEVEMLFVRVN